MKPDELPATTKEYWGKKMKTKKINPEPGMTEQLDPMAMEQLNAMRGNPNLRPMGNKKSMRRERPRPGARVCKAG
jgi:hypothetical protein